MLVALLMCVGEPAIVTVIVRPSLALNLWAQVPFRADSRDTVTPLSLPCTCPQSSLKYNPEPRGHYFRWVHPKGTTEL